MKKLLIILSLFPLLTFAQADWQVRPSAYEHSMTITGVVSYGGELYDQSAGIKVAAFTDDTTCVGMAENHYFSKVRKYRVPLMIYGNENGKAITLKVYLPDQDTVCVLDKAYEFVSDQSYGNYVEPEVWSLDGETGLAEAIEDQVKVYPNPARDYIRVEHCTQAQIYDASGRFYPVSSKMLSSELELDIRQLKAGLYLIRTDKTVHKVMIQ